MRALAHPVRLAILSRLNREGPSTATRLAPDVGATPSVTSWHLRHLASFGLVRDATVGADGRERWWESAARGFRFAAPEDPTDAEGAAAYRALSEQMFLQADALPRRWFADVEPELPARWRRLGGLANTRVIVSASGSRRSRRASRRSWRRRPARRRRRATGQPQRADPALRAPRQSGVAVTTTTAPTPSRSLWRDRRFRTFWIGETLSQFGDRISELALPLIAVVLLDASPTQVGLLTAAVWGPNLVSLFVGSWVDQQPRKRVLLVVADLARAAVLATIPLAYAVDALTLVHLYVVALLAGLGQVLFSTAYPPFFVALVPRDRFLDANSKLSASRSASFIAGPAVGGALVQALTAPVAILVDALTFVASAFQIGRVRVEEAPVENPHGHSLLRRAREGLVYVLRHPFLRYSLGCATTPPTPTPPTPRRHATSHQRHVTTSTTTTTTPPPTTPPTPPATTNQHTMPPQRHQPPATNDQRPTTPAINYFTP